MRVSPVLCGLLLAVAIANASPIVKRQTNDITPLEEKDADPALEDQRSDRDKRKIGIVKLGVSNGIINFVFGKLDAFLDAKTRALAVLDQSNKAKNAIFGIDNTQSATSQFIGNLISQKIQAGTGSIGPIVNSATTFLSTASSGLAGAFASKFAPLSSLTGGLSSGSGGSGSGALGGILASGIGALTNLSGSSNLSGGGGDSSESGVSSGSSAGATAGASVGAGAGINLGAFTNLGGAKVSSTTEDIPEFDRKRVSLDVPGPAFGSGFNLITNVSKVISSVILNSAHRTQSVLEALKPFFRGVFAIKGLPSDNPK